MKRLPTLHLVLAFAICLLGGTAHAQVDDLPGPVGGVPATLPEIRLPGAQDLRIAVPRQVRAAQALIGEGRQRLALVLGLGKVGNRLVVDNAPRDAQAVAGALRNGGFIVMLREDVTANELRASLKEFRERLQPGGMGFVYVTGLGVQVNGQNLLLPRETTLDAALDVATLKRQLRASAVPLDEVTAALLGTTDSPRMLVVDAAYQHPVLAKLLQPGLAEQKLPPGLMALFGTALGTAQEVPAVAPLPIPAPTDPAALAATPFVRVLVASLQKARISGPDALRATRRSIVDTTLGQSSPWLGGDTDGNEELAEASLLDGLVPRTPEEAAREALRHAGRLITRPASRAGEQSVAEVLQASANNAAAAVPSGAVAPADTSLVRAAPPERERPLPDRPGANSLASSIGTAASVVGTVASVATTAAAVGAAVRVAEVTAAASLATAAASTGVSVLGNAVALAARAGSSDTPAREAVRQTTSAVAAVPALAPVAPIAPVAPATPIANVIPSVAAVPTASTPAALAAQPTAAADTARRLAQAAATAAADPGNTAPPLQVAPARPLRDPRAPDGRTQRNANGGERPTFIPRSNSFGYAEGDTFTYQITDTWKGEVVGETTTAIEEVLGDGSLLANGQLVQMDPQGRMTRRVNTDGSVSEFLPRQDLWWSNPERGQSQAVNFVEKIQRDGLPSSQTEWRGSARVGGLRRLETPAGEFWVLPIESSGWWTEILANGTRSSGQWSRTVYYAPKLGHPVAIEVEDADRLGKLLKRERVELMQAQQLRTTP